MSAIRSPHNSMGVVSDLLYVTRGRNTLLLTLTAWIGSLLGKIMKVKAIISRALRKVLGEFIKYIGFQVLSYIYPRLRNWLSKSSSSSVDRSSTGIKSIELSFEEEGNAVGLLFIDE